MTEVSPSADGWTKTTKVLVALTGLVAAVGSTVGALVAAGVIGGDANASLSAPPARTETAPGGGGFPNDAEAEVLTWIAPSARESCTRGLPYPPASLATVTCSSAGVDAFAYSAFGSAESLYQHYNRKFGGAERTDSCRSGREWAFADEAVPTWTGRAYCWRDPETGIAWVEWTADWARIYAYARRDDGDTEALLDWWSRSGGPIRPTG